MCIYSVRASIALIDEIRGIVTETVFSIALKDDEIR